MAATTYYWHDYETFGANPRFDWPSQFAGIRTDADFNVIGDPLVRYCQPPTDRLPEPAACLITGITPQTAEREGLPEPEFIAAIHAELSRPGTCGVGYNSLRFDDEVTRHALWRNFFDPYRREWADGCSRWDIIDMVRLTYALRPDGIEWPTREDGAPSFKLEHLAAANHLEQARAHDALSDVHATIGLARLIRERQPRLYEFVQANRDKASARALLDVDNHRPVLHVSEKFPAELGCLSLVMPIVAHPVNRNAVIAFDLRHDPADLLALPPEDIHERLFTPAADLPEGVARIPLKGIHINKCPVLAPASMLSPAEAERLQLDGDTLRRHRDALMADIDTVSAKVQAVFAQGEFDDRRDPEQDLYGGFVPDADRAACERVRRADGAELATDPPAFEDPRLRELLFRYRARYFPDTLDAGDREEWQNWRERRLSHAPDGGLTLDDYDELLAQLPDHIDGDAAKLQILLDLKAWGDQLRRF
ncbi:exodeoxyribonuclease I [Salinisphaera sp. P385]|uniref:Exodeoxyribonuclease I n=1 Tax=Spectribacter acetivorans TaxID=3075603 RepID=A0ABU3B617_9GAMM|nr:exodeoxyribonuclease I [Salinisphaera sp. P385]MDT0617902.1 exodeoxyribonuclease I [Salinisphaera sp. P385]